MMGADVIVGAKRLLEAVPEGANGEKKDAILGKDILEIIKGAGDKDVCVVYSGDTGFYSGTRSPVPLLDKEGIIFW